MSDHEDLYRRLNNELVVPAYRDFCDELDLPFHFWNELPQSAFDAQIGHREFQLHDEAMNLFNRLKPELVFFNDDVVSYQFTESGGHFEYQVTPINQFLEETADCLFYLQRIERRFDLVCSILVALISCLTYVGTLWLLVTLIGDGSSMVQLVALVLPVSLGVWIWRLVRRMPKRIIDDGRLIGLPERILALRTKLADIRGDGPDPRRARKMGTRILSELRQSMSDEEIHKLVRRLQSRLFLVPRDES